LVALPGSVRWLWCCHLRLHPNSPASWFLRRFQAQLLPQPCVSFSRSSAQIFGKTLICQNVEAAAHFAKLHNVDTVSIQGELLSLARFTSRCFLRVIPVLVPVSFTSARSKPCPMLQFPKVELCPGSQPAPLALIASSRFSLIVQATR
jgi:hypothetical protein